MTFTTVQNSTIFDAFYSAPQNATAKANVLAAMQDAYNRSPIARNMFDTWVNAGKTISIGFDTLGEARAFTNTGKVLIDPAFPATNTYITTTGEAFVETLQSVLLHELGHALNDLYDADPSDPTNTVINYTNYTSLTTNYMGENIAFVNGIFKELGIPESVSYIAQADVGTLHTTGFQYTGGAIINGAVSANQDINTSNLGTSRDLLIGGLSSNTLISGDGNDFLYGAGGNDVLQSGKGSDFLIGMSGNDQLEGAEGNDTYGFSKKDGKDTITDTDGQGQIVIDGKAVSGAAKYVNATTWTLDVYTLTKAGADVKIAFDANNDNHCIQLCDCASKNNLL